ncbi:putative major facilitator, sugar transporter, major facilitator superfamily [Helianthus anomalus]
MSGAQKYIQKYLHCGDTQIEILVGILNLYSLVGSAAAGRTSDWIGRRYTIVLAGAIFFLGAILMGFATNYAFLMVGRFVAGIGGVGYALMIAPVYTTEISPASARGFLSSFPDFFINVGILLGYVSNYAFSKLPTHLGWRFMLGLGAIPSIFLALGVLGMPESPRWLVMQGRLGDAKKVLDNLEESKLRLTDIKEAAGIPKYCDDEIVKVENQSHGEGIWKELFIHLTPTVRHILMVTVGLHIFQQGSGIDTVVLYSPRIFEKPGIVKDTPQLLATIGVGFVKTMFILMATFLIDRIGRRPLLLTSIAGMSVSLMLLGFALTIIDHSDHMGYSSLHRRGSILRGVLFEWYGSDHILTWVYSDYIGGAFFFYACVAVVGFVLFYTLFPETQGKNLEEVEQLFGTFFKWKSRQAELNRKKR